MSEAEKAKQELDVFLQQVRLKNYKSIIDAKIDFKPGLNIIIGNNGSGKTNVLNYLYEAIYIDWDEVQNLFVEFTFIKNNNSYTVEVKKSDMPITGLDIISLGKKKVKVSFKKNDIIEFDEKEINTENFDSLISNEIYYYVRILQYGVPLEQNIIEKPAQITFSHGSFFPIVNDIDTSQTYFIKSLFDKLSVSIFYASGFDSSKAETIIKDLNDFVDNIRHALNSFTDIKDLQVSPNFNLYPNGVNNKINIHNLYLEFFVNNSWVPYSYLSDGSKRLFYIISEFISYSQIDILKSFNRTELAKELKFHHEIILLEEPELGIHPHQLHKLMLFIKEQSKDKQIILTTHSPQVLNILGPDELDRIIICSYDQQKGTQLNHLTERQISKGQLYMQDEGFLSDYWVHSDLEPAINI